MFVISPIVSASCDRMAGGVHALVKALKAATWPSHQQALSKAMRSFVEEEGETALGLSMYQPSNQLEKYNLGTLEWKNHTLSEQYPPDYSEP